MCENENFIAICNYADAHLWADWVITIIACFIQLHFFILAMCQKAKFNRIELIIFTTTVILGTVLKTITPYFIGLIFDLWQLIIMPICFLLKDKKRIKNVFIGNILLAAFQFLSLITKNIGISILSESMLEGLIFSIDIFIIIILYYCYSNLLRKEKT